MRLKRFVKHFQKMALFIMFITVSEILVFEVEEFRHISAE